jgi:hypothetical protein
MQGPRAPLTFTLLPRIRRERGSAVGRSPGHQQRWLNPTQATSGPKYRSSHPDDRGRLPEPSTRMFRAGPSCAQIGLTSRGNTPEARTTDRNVTSARLDRGNRGRKPADAVPQTNSCASVSADHRRRRVPPRRRLRRRHKARAYSARCQYDRRSDIGHRLPVPVGSGRVYRQRRRRLAQTRRRRPAGRSPPAPGQRHLGHRRSPRADNAHDPAQGPRSGRKEPPRSRLLASAGEARRERPPPPLNCRGTSSSAHDGPIARRRQAQTSLATGSRAAPVVSDVVRLNPEAPCPRPPAEARPRLRPSNAQIVRRSDRAWAITLLTAASSNREQQDGRPVPLCARAELLPTRMALSSRTSGGGPPIGVGDCCSRIAKRKRGTWSVIEWRHAAWAAAGLASSSRCGSNASGGSVSPSIGYSPKRLTRSVM